LYLLHNFERINEIGKNARNLIKENLNPKKILSEIDENLPSYFDKTFVSVISLV